MIIELCKIPIREVFEGYVNNDEEKIVERNPELKEPEFSVEVKLTSTEG